MNISNPEISVWFFIAVMWMTTLFAYTGQWEVIAGWSTVFTLLTIFKVVSDV